MGFWTDPWIEPPVILSGIKLDKLFVGCCARYREVAQGLGLADGSD